MNDSIGDAIRGSAGYRLGVIGARLEAVYRRRVDRLGLTPKQVGLLAVLDTRDGLSQREVATSLGVAPSLVVSLVDDLLAADLVTRTRRATDRRVQEVRVSASGREVLAKAAESAVQLEAEVREALTPTADDALGEVLDGLDEATRGLTADPRG